MKIYLPELGNWIGVLVLGSYDLVQEEGCLSFDGPTLVSLGGCLVLGRSPSLSG